VPEKFWEDFSVGDKVTSMAITVTETHVVTWAGLTMDYYPLHMDKEYAAKTPFKERIVHGPLTFAMAVGLMGMTGYAKDSVIAWLGVDDMRIPAPVKIGDTIRLHAEIVELRETKNASQGFTMMRYEVVNQREEAVMTFNMKFLMHRRGKG
jgi:itaconyl-CoA hydratase